MSEADDIMRAWRAHGEQVLDDFAKPVTNKKEPLPLPKKAVADRFNDGKPEMSYILHFPKSMEALARVCEAGAKKYSYLGWKKGGKPDQEYYDSALRHLFKAVNGERFDPETGCLHIAQAVWNLCALIDNNHKGPLCVAGDKDNV